MTRIGRAALIGSLAGLSPAVHPEAWIAPGATVIGAVSIGRGASIWYGAVLRADDDSIWISDECNIQDLCCFHVDAGQPAVLEPRVSVGHHATVHGATIGTGALIGIGATVLGGARIGPGALVAAGAVVRPGAVVPAGVLYAGVPGRVVRELTDDDHARLERTALGYVARAQRHRQVRWRDLGQDPGEPGPGEPGAGSATG
ncbi:MAG TPA: gamma carbonic anhydrase family protein [Streptosporangiaceae bacterium]|nr:gamma carbonic anhydrase family protein [Streptosporangiaceae bacterium]